MSTNSTGNCYLCGVSLGKAAMKNHFLKCHEDKDGEECLLIKVEGAYNKDYWLYIDIPVKDTLRNLEDFLRMIWLECCGHMSEFYTNSKAGYGPTRLSLKLGMKLSSFAVGDKFFHDYDFGTTTVSLITIMGIIKRKQQKGSVRLLARNVPPVFQCVKCNETAVYINTEDVYSSNNPFYCKKCAEEDDFDMMLPITNSPRMGECAYDGELDTFAFNPALYQK